MIRNILTGIVLIIAIVTILLLAFVYFCKPKISMPKRPANVPLTAVWTGGAEGGTWIDCRNIPNQTNLFLCTIYNDYDGEVIDSALFRIDGEQISLEELKSLIRFYDGHKIVLKDNRILKSIKKDKQ